MKNIKSPSPLGSGIFLSFTTKSCDLKVILLTEMGQGSLMMTIFVFVQTVFGAVSANVLS